MVDPIIILLLIQDNRWKYSICIVHCLVDSKTVQLNYITSLRTGLCLAKSAESQNILIVVPLERVYVATWLTHAHDQRYSSVSCPRAQCSRTVRTYDCCLDPTKKYCTVHTYITFRASLSESSTAKRDRPTCCAAVTSDMLPVSSRFLAADNRCETPGKRTTTLLHYGTRRRRIATETYGWRRSSIRSVMFCCCLTCTFRCHPRATPSRPNATESP
jgi:hypothetical protein